MQFYQGNFGIPINFVTVCKQMLALPPYGKLTASTEKSYKKGSSCLADDAHIMTNKAWCAKDNNGMKCV